MGLFDKLFKKAETKMASSAPACDPSVVYAPAEGTAIPLEQFPDALFSGGDLGPGCGIEPTGDTVYAPFSGEVTQVIDSLHAVGVTSESGIELLIHIGVDTVAMNGKGFRSFVRTGDKIVRGQKMIAFDRSAIKKAGYLDTIAVIVTNGEDYKGVNLLSTGSVSVGADLLRVVK
jgi:glucose-specific phosphotransferase system IIA component